MPVQFDEYGIPVKQKSQSEVDEYGIPIKKKVGGNGNGSISETPSNPFLAAKRPTGVISNAQVLEAKQGIGASQNRNTEQQIAAGTPLQREILSDKGSWTREQVNQAAINTADKYFENNPELTFSLNKLKKDNNISLKNVPLKEEDKFSVKSLKNTTAYQRKVAEIKTAFEEGNLALTKFQSGEKAGEAVFTRPAKFLRGIGQGIEGGFNMTKDAVIDKISSDKEFADYLDKQNRNLPEIPTEAPSGLGNEIGLQLGSVIKPMAEFGIGAGLTAEMGGWGGFVALAADAIPSRTTAKTKELYFEKIAQLQEKYGENIPEEERINAMREARSDAPLQAVPEEAMEMYMFGRGAKALGTTPTGLAAFKKSLEKAGVDIPKFGLLGGAEEAASLGISRLQGNEVHDAGKKIGQAIEDWAAMEAAFKVLHGVTNAPKYLRSSAKEVMAEHPEVAVKLNEEAVAQGWVTKEQADLVQADLEQYNRIRSTLPDDIPSDKAAAVTGLLQRNEVLEEKKKNTNAIFHDEIDAEIDNNTAKAKQILNSSQPLKYETDELTGERGQDVGGRPSAIAEEKVETKTEITPEETDVRVTAVDERQSSNEGSKTEKDVGETIQEKQALNADKYGDVYTTKQPAQWDAQLNYERGKKRPKYVYLTVVDNPSKEASAYGHETASPSNEVKIVKSLGELDAFRENEDAPLSAGEFEGIRQQYAKENNIPLDNVEYHLSTSDELPIYKQENVGEDIQPQQTEVDISDADLRKQLKKDGYDADEIMSGSENKMDNPEYKEMVDLSLKIHDYKGDIKKGANKTDVKRYNELRTKFPKTKIELKPNDETLLPLLDNKDVAVRREVVDYSGATENALMKAVKQQSFPIEVALRAVRNKNATEAVLKEALKHSEPEVRFAAEEKLKSTEHPKETITPNKQEEVIQQPLSAENEPTTTEATKPISEIKESEIGKEFEFRGKTYVVQNVESNGVHAKLKGDEKSQMKLILPIDKYNEATGKNIEAPKRKEITAEDKSEEDIIRKAELVKYKGGENGRQYIDRYIADGYNKVISIKQGAVNKFYLDNEKTGLQLPISGDLRKYAELALEKQKSISEIKEPEQNKVGTNDVKSSMKFNYTPMQESEKAVKAKIPYWEATDSSKKAHKQLYYETWIPKSVLEKGDEYVKTWVIQKRNEGRLKNPYQKLSKQPASWKTLGEIAPKKVEELVTVIDEDKSAKIGKELTEKHGVSLDKIINDEVDINGNEIPQTDLDLAIAIRFESNERTKHLVPTKKVKIYKDEPTPTKVTEPTQQIKEPTKEQTIKETVSEDIKSDRPIGAETKPTVLDLDVEKNYNSQIKDKGYADVFIFSDLVLDELPKGTYKVRHSEKGGIEYFDANGKQIGKNKKGTKEDFISISEKVVEHYKLREQKKNESATVPEPPKPKGKYETKANEIADKIRKSELPSWLSSKDPNIKKQGIGADDIKEALANAVVEMGRLLDSGVEFSKAAKEAVKDLVNALGKEREEEIVKNFSDYYNEQTGNKPKQEDLVSVEQPKTVLSHRGIQEISTEFGMEDVQRRSMKSDIQLRKDADDTIQSWKDEGSYSKNVEGLIKNAEEGKVLTDEDRLILQDHLATEREKLRKLTKAKVINDEYRSQIDKVYRLKKASEKTRSEAGAALRVGENKSVADETLEGYLAQEQDLNKGAPLTDNQIKTAVNEFTKIDAASNEFKEKFEKLQADYAKLLAEREVKKQAASTKKNQNKTHEDYVKERKSYLDEFKALGEKHKQELQEKGIHTQGVGGLTIDQAKIIGKIVKSYVEEGVSKLDEIVGKVFEDLDKEVPQEEIRNVIAGAYAEKKKTRNEVVATMRDIQIQQQLLNKYDAMLKGEQPKTEKAKIRFNQEIHDLRQKIKGLEKEEKEANTFYGESESGNKRIENLEDELQRLKERRPKENTPKEKREISEREAQLKKEISEEQKAIRAEEKEANERYKEEIDPRVKMLQKIKERNERRLTEIADELDKGDFAKPEKKTPLIYNEELKKNFPKAYKEALESQKRLAVAKAARGLRIAIKEYENLTPSQKAAINAQRWANVPRTLSAGGDLSAPGRQGLVASVAYPSLAAKAAGSMLKSAKSQANYDLIFHNIRERENYDLYKDSKLNLTDPNALKPEQTEEMFSGGNVVEKIPLFGTHYIKGSERAYVSYLNQLRVDIFDLHADRMKEQGKTFANSPEEYKALASYVNTITGAGNVHEAFKRYMPFLNSTLFAPKLIASRLNMLGITDIPNLAVQGARQLVKGATLNKVNPKWNINFGFYSKLPREIRVTALKSMAKTIGVGVSVLLAAKAAGLEVEYDPRSTDFGKIKVGNTRYDIWGGMQPYVRLFAQLFSGYAKSAQTGMVYELDQETGKFGRDEFNQVVTFGRGKLNPILSGIADIGFGKTVVGEPVIRRWDIPFMRDENDAPEGSLTLTDAIGGKVLPLLWQDIGKAFQDKGVSALFSTGIPSSLGIGANTYEPSETVKQFDVKDSDWKFILDKTGRLPVLKETQVEIVDENGKRRQMTTKEFNEFIIKRNNKIKESVGSLRQNGALFLDADGNVTEVKSAKDMTDKEIAKWLGLISAKATAETKSEMFGDNEDLDKIKIETNE